jgi:2-polyprenyl-3-methyl-5-hydroxy-6-metoxy-1,4-benzoquinol methylase
MAAYYPEGYGPHRRAPPGRAAAAARRPRWRLAAGSLVQRLSDSKAESLPPLPPGRLLEVGCATGTFLRKMASAGWQVEGIESSVAAAAEARSTGLTVHTGRIESAPEPSHPFDLAVAWMALEHLHQPVAALEKVAAWTKPRGWLALSVPDAGAVEAAVFGSSWYALDLPRHLYHFDRHTLARLLQKTGWRIERIITQRNAMNLVASIGYVLEDLGAAPAAAAWLKNAPEREGRLPLALFPLAFLLAAVGQTGRMTVWARRSE